ncbi:MAG: helix-turn-helix domain-containing protein [Actinomycetota bacterium]|nr:helix-turn-helix domain-containing protein [Actinomycetota bacterium]
MTLSDPVTWADPTMQQLLASRDVTAIFRQLVEQDMNQSQLASLVGMSQSEVSEVLSGRRVMAYAVFERVAEGLGIRRGAMGLAYHGASPSDDEGEEVDEDVERRRLLALVGSIIFGAPVFGEAEPRTLRDIATKPPKQVGVSDVSSFNATVTRLGVLDREAGGMAAREALAATAKLGETMLRAQASEDVRTGLRRAVSEAPRLAGWASGDVGLVDHCRWHMHRALDHVAGDSVRVAQVLCSAGDMEKHHGDSNTALKLFQLAQMGTERAQDPQAQAVISGLSSSAYLTLGYPQQAREHLTCCRRLFQEADPADSLPFFTFYGPGSGLPAANGLKMADYEGARQGAIPQVRRAIDLLGKVGSQRVRDRLEPLEQALAGRQDSTCRDLARVVQTVRAIP